MPFSACTDKKSQRECDAPINDGMMARGRPFNIMSGIRPRSLAKIDERTRFWPRRVEVVPNGGACPISGESCRTFLPIVLQSRGQSASWLVGYRAQQFHNVGYTRERFGCPKLIYVNVASSARLMWVGPIAVKIETQEN